MEWEQMNEILNKGRKQLDNSILRTKKQLILDKINNINSSLHFNEWLNIEIPLYTAPLHLFSLGRLCVYPTEQGEVIYIDDEFYNNNENKDVVVHQYTHELLHSLRQVKKTENESVRTLLFAHKWFEYDHIFTGIDEATTQMFTDDFENFRLSKEQDNSFYFIKNIMRFMKVIFGEEKLLMQYLNYNQEFEKEFNKMSNNRFIEFARLINDIYNLEKEKTNIAELEYKKKEVINIVKSMVREAKKTNPNIMDLISNDLQDDDFLNFYKVNTIENESINNQTPANSNGNELIVAKLKTRLAEYVKAIVEMYGKDIPQDRLVELIHLNYDDDLINIYDYGSINGMANDKSISLPLCADRLFKIAKKIPGYAINKNHRLYSDDNLLLNNNGFLKYVFHAFISGTDTEGYYEDILLHEALHFCGSGGSSALREGMNELLTRKLAKEKGFRTNGSAYPKEVNVVYHLQELFGEDIINKISFMNSEGEIALFLTTHLGMDACSLYLSISREMEKEFNEKYYSKFDTYNGISGVIRKTLNYHKINYSKIYQMMDNYRKQKNINNSELYESEMSVTKK